MNTYYRVRWWMVAVVLLLNACASGSFLKDRRYAPPQPEEQVPRTEVNGAIYHTSSNLFLFEDIKARRVGDILTVVLEEKTKASKTASTAASKEGDVDIPNPTIFGDGLTINGQEIFSNSLKSNRNFNGKGDSNQSNSLDGSISVSVVKVLSNGYLMVKGEKLLTLNQGSEVVRISGIVRPFDIDTANTIHSSQIANAEITYSGSGITGDSNKAGWLTRFFYSTWWPL